MKYLADRGVTTDDILRLKLGYCEEGPYYGRIIFPSFDDMGDLNFFVGRSFYGSTMRYKHERYSKDIIFNDYLIDWREPVTLVEGPFDALKARDNAIPLQANLLIPGTKLFSKIILSGVDVYMALDKKEFDKQVRIMRDLVGYGMTSFFVNIGNRKDVGEMTHDEFAEAKRNARRISSDIDLAKLRIEHWA